MRNLLIIFLLINLSLKAQDGMVMISGDVSHQINVPDDLTGETVERWKYEMKQGEIEFQEPLRKIDEIVLVERDYYFLSEKKGKTIYLNKALNEHPYCKRAAIIQMLFINQGGKLDKKYHTLATAPFKISDRSEGTFKKQYTGGSMFTSIINKLKN